MDELIRALMAQTEALSRVAGAIEDYTTSNAALIQILMEEGEDEPGNPATDMEGNPIRGNG